MSKENDLISRNALLERCKEIASVEWNKKAAPVSWSDAYEHFADEVEEAPAVDAVEVVRCRDCKHGYIHADSGNYECLKDGEYDEDGIFFGFSAFHDAGFYCADGERRADHENP